MLHIYKQKHIKMETTDLKKEIEKLAKEENITFIEACQALQSAANKLGDEKMITIIHKIKMQELKHLFI